MTCDLPGDVGRVENSYCIAGAGESIENLLTIIILTKFKKSNLTKFKKSDSDKSKK